MSLEPTADPPETIFDIRSVPNDYTIFWAKCPECRDTYHSFNDTDAQRQAYVCYYGHDWTDDTPPGDGESSGEEVLAEVRELVAEWQPPEIAQEVMRR